MALVFVPRLLGLSPESMLETANTSFMEPEMQTRVMQCYAELLAQLSSFEHRRDLRLWRTISDHVRDNLLDYIRQTPLSMFGVHIQLFVAILLLNLGEHGVTNVQNVTTLYPLLRCMSDRPPSLILQHITTLQQSLSVNLATWARVVAPCLDQRKMFQFWFAQVNGLRYRYFEWVRSDARYLPENQGSAPTLVDMIRNPDLGPVVERVRQTNDLKSWSRIRPYFYTKAAIREAIQQAGLASQAKLSRSCSKSQHLRLLYDWQQNPPNDSFASLQSRSLSSSSSNRERYMCDVTPIVRATLSVFEKVTVPKLLRMVTRSYLVPSLRVVAQQRAALETSMQLQQLREQVTHPLNRRRLPIVEQEQEWQSRNPRAVQLLSRYLRISQAAVDDYVNDDNDDDDGDNDGDDDGDHDNRNRNRNNGLQCPNVDPMTLKEPHELRRLPLNVTRTDPETGLSYTQSEVISFYMNGKEPKHCVHRKSLYRFWRTSTGYTRGNCEFLGVYSHDLPADLDESTCAMFYKVPLPQLYISDASRSTLEQHPEIIEWDLMYDPDVYVTLGVFGNFESETKRLREPIYQLQPHVRVSHHDPDLVPGLVAHG